MKAETARRFAISASVGSVVTLSSYTLFLIICVCVLVFVSARARPCVGICVCVVPVCLQGCVYQSSTDTHQSQPLANPCRWQALHVSHDICHRGYPECTSVVLAKHTGLSDLPVYDGTHVETDILESPQRALLHRLQVHQLLVDMDQLHAALEGPLCGGQVGPGEVACRWYTHTEHPGGLNSSHCDKSS